MKSHYLLPITPLRVELSIAIKTQVNEARRLPIKHAREGNQWSSELDITKTIRQVVNKKTFNRVTYS